MSDGMERLAMIFSDGSMSVFEAGKTEKQAIKEATDEDPNEHDQAHRPRIARMSVTILEMIPVPSKHVTGGSCPTCGRS